jgi:beta-phosphoglucomutase
MEWINNFDLFLFDFDGLLVDTEGLHYKAYKELCRRRGYMLPWDLSQYLHIAHSDTIGIRQGLQALFPELLKEAWEDLYAEKKKIYETYLQSGELSLLPGVEPLLKELARLNKKRCVVTNSPLLQINLIKSQIPVLQTIPRWFTRETYDKPKPAPDGYLKALHELKAEGDHVIGFEDSIKGYASLKQAGVTTPILICPPTHYQLKHFDDKRFYAPSMSGVACIL